MKKIFTALLMIQMFLLVLTASAQGIGSWTEYSENPIFGQGSSGPKAYYPSIIYDPDGFSGHGISATYKMWYGTSGQQTGYATSNDGISWIDHGVVMSDGYHATIKYFPNGFDGANIGENPSGSIMYYRMWYWDYSIIYSVTAIGYTESPDGANWFNYQPLQNGATVQIITGVSPDWNRGSYGPCDILYNPDASNTGTDWVFTMYYDGTTGGDEAIGLGFSSDGITWTGYDADSDSKADPVFNGTYVSGDWDYNYVSRATILKNGDNDYRMWYSGGTGEMNHGIGYASSMNGIDWTRDSNNPIFHKDDGIAWRDSRTYCPVIIKDGNSYKMWFTGKDIETGYYAIGYATAAPPTVIVEIDIEPCCYPNNINLKSKGKTSVAVLTTENFDAGTIDPNTVTFADASSIHWAQEDVDDDGDTDMLFYFQTQSLNLDSVSTEAILEGETYDGQKIEGTDTVNIVSKLKWGFSENTKSKTSVSVPKEFSMLPNYPNPFNPETRICFQLPEESYVVLKIFNANGQEIRVLAEGQFETGYHKILWDGRDNNGNAVLSGVYFCQINADKFATVNKMILLR